MAMAAGVNQAGLEWRLELKGWSYKGKHKHGFSIFKPDLHILHGVVGLWVSEDHSAPSIGEDNFRIVIYDRPNGSDAVSDWPALAGIFKFLGATADEDGKWLEFDAVAPVLSWEILDIDRRVNFDNEWIS